MADELAQKLIKRSDFLFGEKNTWNALWDAITRYIVPRKKGIFGKVPGAKQTQELYDSTGIHAAERLAFLLNGYLTSPVNRWFTVLPDVEEVEEELLKLFEQASQRQYTVLRNSNFYSQVSEVYLDLVTMGTASLYYKFLGHGSIHFLALPVEEYAIAENEEGEVETLYRRFSLTAENAVERWGDNAGKSILDTNKKNPYELVPIIHAVYPRTTRNRDKRDKTNMPFASVHISARDKTVIAEGGFLRFPFFVPRWAKSSGEVYGRSPAMTALPDVKTTNKAREITLKGGGKQINPPLVIQADAFLKKLDITEGAINEVQMGQDASTAAHPLVVGVPMDSALVFLNDLRKSVKEIFFADQVETLMAIGGPAKTATEVQIQYELLQQMLGPTLGRIEGELLSPLVRGVFMMLYEEGEFSDLAGYYEGKRPDIKIRYEGVLAKAQRSTEVLALQRFEEAVVLSANQAPDVVDNINYDDLIRYKAQLLGVPLKIFRPQENVEALREQRAQTQAEDKQAQEALATTEGVKNVSGLFKGNGERRGF